MLSSQDRVLTIGALVRSVRPVQPLIIKDMLIKKIKQENNLSIK